MGWLGKAVGGILGWTLGGPLGAILGAAAGHLYDKSVDEGSGYRFSCPGCGRTLTAKRMGVYACPHCSAEFELLNCPSCGAGVVVPHAGYEVFSCPGCGADIRTGDTGYLMARKQMTAALAFFALAGKLAKIDGRVSEEEIEVVSRFMDSIGMDADSREVAKRIFREAKRSPHDYKEIALQFKHEFKYEPQLTRILIDFLLAIAHADGTFSAAERAMIEDLVKILELPAHEYEALLAAYNPAADIEKYYRILGVSPEASDEEIKARYRELVRNFHPDMLASKGLAPEFLEFANQRMQEINMAYKKVMEFRSRAG